MIGSIPSGKMPETKKNFATYLIKAQEYQNAGKPLELAEMIEEASKSGIPEDELRMLGSFVETALLYASSNTDASS